MEYAGDSEEFAAVDGDDVGRAAGVAARAKAGWALGGGHPGPSVM